MRGATPLDVAAASVMDNNELALALIESDLQKVISPSPVLHPRTKGPDHGSPLGAALARPLSGGPGSRRLWTEELPPAAG